MWAAQPYLPVVMGAVMSNPSVHACNCICGHSHTHTDRKWIRRRLVGGNQKRSVCHSWKVPSGCSQSECVFMCGVSYTWGYYSPVSQTQVQTRPAHIPTFLSVNHDVRERLFVYLAWIVELEFVSCDVNAFNKLSSWVSSNRMHFKSERFQRQSGVY